MSDDSMVYVATAPCGCVHGIDCGDGKETARQVADLIQRGSTVDRRRQGGNRHQLPARPAVGSSVSTILRIYDPAECST